MKTLFKRILCPVSFDANSSAALDVACGLAQERGATILLIHVVSQPPPGSAPIPIEPYPQTERDAAARLERTPSPSR